VNEREAAIASLRCQRAGVELEGFDRIDDLVIRHRVIVTDRARTVRTCLIPENAGFWART
jgi:hypothetical protein